MFHEARGACNQLAVGAVRLSARGRRPAGLLASKASTWRCGRSQVAGSSSSGCRRGRGRDAAPRRSSARRGTAANRAVYWPRIQGPHQAAFAVETRLALGPLASYLRSAACFLVRCPRCRTTREVRAEEPAPTTSPCACSDPQVHCSRQLQLTQCVEGNLIITLD